MATLQPGEHARMYALGKVARGGATRGGYVDGRVYIQHGPHQFGWVRSNPLVGTIIESLQIVDMLDEQPNTCRYRVNGWVPPIGVEVRVTLGSKNCVEPRFAGHALTVSQLYVGDNPDNVQADVTAVDYTWLLGNLLVTKYYYQQSATTIALDLIAAAAGNGFTGHGVTPNLPVLNEMTFTNENLATALSRLARRLGAYWYVDGQKDVHLFFTEPQRPDPAALTPSHRSLADLRFDEDRTQTLTRVYVEGRGTTLVTYIPPGETKLPVVNAEMFEAVASDVFIKVSPPGSDGGSQHLTYTAAVRGESGCLVGPGIGPSAAPVLMGQPGTGIDAGSHVYAYTFVTNAGETRPSPLATTQVGAVANPTVPATATFFQTATANGNFMTIGDTVQFSYAYSTGDPTIAGDVLAKQTLAAPPSVSYVLPSNNDPFNPGMVAGINLTIPFSTDARVTTMVLYIYSSTVTHEWRAFYDGPDNDPAGGPVVISIRGADYGLTGYPLPPANNTAVSVINVTAIATGGTAVTQRKVYRSAANTAQLKLLTTIANNTATTFLDTQADSTLGANAPIGDTSGLQQPAGQVVPGDTELPVASTAPFEAAGGWASIGNGKQDIRYAGLSSTSLTGIPKTGRGSITAAIAFNSTITATPMLIGIPASGAGAIHSALTRGDELYLVVQVDDTARQTALAADVGGDGVREEWVQDRRLSIAEARARGQATLQVRPLDQGHLSYTCRDLRTASGRTIAVDLPAPTSLSGSYKIQQVTIDNFRPHATQYPTFTVDASSSRFSFEDWLRILRTKE